jgi:outer membrane protein TolC
MIDGASWRRLPARRSWLAALLLLGGPLAPARADSPLPPAAAQELDQALLPPGARQVPRDAPIPRLSFAEAIEQALARNPTALSAREDIQRAQALVEQVRSSALPVVTLAASYLRLDGDRLLSTPGDPPGTGRLLAGADQLSATLTVSAPLVAPPRWAQWRHAADSVQVARVGASEVRRLLAIATARSYLAVVAQARLLQVSVSAREVAQAHFGYAEQRYHGGVGNHLDEVRAAQEVATSEAQLQAARSALYRAREALGVLVGADQAIDSTGEPDLPVPSDLGAGPDPLIEEALVERGDLRLLQVRAWAQSRLVRDRWMEYLPTLIGSFGPFYQNPPTLTQPLLGWQAQLSLTVPLYDGGLRYGTTHERWALYRQSKLSLKLGQQQARSDVRVAYEALHRAHAARAAAGSAAELASEAVALSALAYRAGATTNLEVVDAERRARDAAIAATQAEDAARQAHLDLLIASGQFPARSASPPR